MRPGARSKVTSSTAPDGSERLHQPHRPNGRSGPRAAIHRGRAVLLIACTSSHRRPVRRLNSSLDEFLSKGHRAVKAPRAQSRAASEVDCRSRRSSSTISRSTRRSSSRRPSVVSASSRAWRVGASTWTIPAQEVRVGAVVVGDDHLGRVGEVGASRRRLGPSTFRRFAPCASRSVAPSPSTGPSSSTARPPRPAPRSRPRPGDRHGGRRPRRRGWSRSRIDEPAGHRRDEPMSALGVAERVVEARPRTRYGSRSARTSTTRKRLVPTTRSS